MEKVAVYVSLIGRSKKLKDNFINEIIDWCLTKNYDYTIYFDRVKDRHTLKGRKEFEHLKEDVANGKYPKVIINNIGQLSRNGQENYNFLEFLCDSNCDLETLNEFETKLWKFVMDKYKIEKERLER